MHEFVLTKQPLAVLQEGQIAAQEGMHMRKSIWTAFFYYVIITQRLLRYFLSMVPCLPFAGAN